MILNERGILQEFDLVIYPVRLIVAIGDMGKDINRLYKPYDEDFNWIGSPKNNPAATYNIKVKKTSDVGCLIWVPKTEEVRGSYISHEASHVALEIFRYVGAKPNMDDQEPFCYLQGAVFRLANNAFYRWKDFAEKKSKTSKKK